MSTPARSARAAFVSNVKRCAWRVAILAVPVALACFAATLFVRDGNLFGENGPIETVSAALWGLTVLGALYGALRADNCTQRLVLVWLGGLALLAGLRELDLHTALNPKVIGEFGVRYRLSWWTSGSVPLWLKLGWGVLFMLVFTGLFYPLFRTRRELSQLLRAGDFRLLMFGAAFFFLAMGFVVDDLLRGSEAIAMETRKMIEETSELIGVCLYAFGVWQILRCPLEPGSSSASPCAVATDAKSPPASP